MRLSLIEAPAVVRSYDAQRGAIADNASILIQIIVGANNGEEGQVGKDAE
jgi:hypothetical protein